MSTDVAAPGTLGSTALSPFVVVAGPPGSGKGTQCALISARLGFVHLSAGDALRDEIERGSEIGRHVRAWVESGRLVPDTIVLEVMLDQLDELGGPALLDGFPRTIAQAEALEHERPGAVELALALVVPRATIVRRLGVRNRGDDHAHALGRRLVAYETQTRPMLSWYATRGLLAQVDGDGPAEVVADAVTQVIVSRLPSLAAPPRTPRPGSAAPSPAWSADWTHSS